MANKDPASASQGVPPSTSEGIAGLNALLEALKSTKTGTDAESKALVDLKDRMGKLAKETKRSKDGVTSLSKALLEMRKRGEDTTHTATAMANEFEDGMKIMSSSSSSMLADQIKAIKLAEKDLAKGGKGSEREMAILNAKRSQLQMEDFRDQRNLMIQKAKMMQASIRQGNVLEAGKGMAMGVANAAIKHGADAAEYLGEALGLESGAMMALGATIGIVLAAFAAFVFVAKKVAQGMVDATEAGNISASSLSDMRIEAIRYNAEVQQATTDTGLTFSVLNGLMKTVNKELGGFLNKAADFAGTVADVGKTFGMANDESVKLATRIAVSSRSQSQMTLKAFTAMGMQAAELKVPLDALADPMLTLAELAGRTGHNVTEASAGLYTMIQAVDGLKKSGMAMFKGMTGADVTKMTKEFSSFISGMDEMTLAAMTFNKNESFEQMSERVGSMGTKGRVDAIRQMMSDYELQGKDKRAELGFMLGAKNMSEATTRGTIAQNVVNKGMSDADFNRQMASDINRQLSERKTAGEAIQFGLDPTAFIMDRIQKVVDLLTRISGSWILGLSGVPGEAGKVAAKVGGAAVAGNNYGVGSVAGKRAAFSTPIPSLR